MTPEKIISVIEMYETRLQTAGIPKRRCAEEKNFGQLSSAQLLAHAHYTCAKVKEYARDPSKQRKTGSHLTVVQMCLSFAGWYTLGELMDHNRSTEGLPTKQQFTPGVTNFREPPGMT